MGIIFLRVFVKRELFKGNLAGGKIPMAIFMGESHGAQLPESIFALEKCNCSGSKLLGGNFIRGNYPGAVEIVTKP